MPATPDLITLFSPKNIVVFILVLTRLSGMLVSAPFFSTFTIPEQVKALFACFVAFIMYPFVAAKTGNVLPSNMPQLIVLLLLEFSIGFFIGFIADLVFQGIRMSGSILSIQMGLSMSEILDPASGEQQTAVSTIYIYLATLIFFATGAHQWLFEAVYLSFNAIPIGFWGFINGGLIQSVLVLSGQVFQIAFGLIMPIFAVLLVADVLLGLMSKMMPQMNIFMVSLPFKVFAGLLLILIFLLGTTNYIRDILIQFMHAISRFFA